MLMCVRSEGIAPNRVRARALNGTVLYVRHGASCREEGCRRTDGWQTSPKRGAVVGWISSPEELVQRSGFAYY